MEHGPDDAEFEDGDRSGPAGDDGAWTADADEVHPEWHAVRPGVDYVAGGIEAERTAVLVRWVLRELLQQRASLERVQAMTDMDGRPYVRIDLAAAGARIVAGLLLDGLRHRGTFEGRAR